MNETEIKISLPVRSNILEVFDNTITKLVNLIIS